MGCKCTSPLCMRLKRRLAPILLLFISVVLMSVFFMNWHLEDPDCALLQKPLEVSQTMSSHDPIHWII